ncbi:transporter substrate-binding domain-containing protein [Rhizobium beringeri]
MAARIAAPRWATSPTTRRFSGAGVSGGLRKEDTELKAKLNTAISAVRASGQYDAITKKYFDFDIYGAK